MESLFENKPLLYSLFFSGAAVFLLASGMSPDLTTKFELVEFVPQVDFWVFFGIAMSIFHSFLFSF